MGTDDRDNSLTNDYFQYLLDNPEIEGRFYHMYLCGVGEITVGMGHKITSFEEIKELDFKHLHESTYFGVDKLLNICSEKVKLQQYAFLKGKFHGKPLTMHGCLWREKSNQNTRIKNALKRKEPVLNAMEKHLKAAYNFLKKKSISIKNEIAKAKKEKRPPRNIPAAQNYYDEKHNFIFLLDEKIDSLAKNDIKIKIEELKIHFPNFSSYPEEVCFALLDMSYNLGVKGLVHGFPTFTKLVHNGEWNTIAEGVDEKNNPHYLRNIRQVGQKRNDMIREKFRLAVANEKNNLSFPEIINDFCDRDNLDQLSEAIKNPLFI